jgi:flagellar P-ring protein precursor FlgI
VGGVGAQASGSSVTVNHLSVGRIAAGATVERAVPNSMGRDGTLTLAVNANDFTTTERIVAAINRAFGDGTAAAIDGRTVQVASPEDSTQRVSFISRVESLDVTPGAAAAKVIVNGRTGSVVMNQTVTVETCAVAHGNLSVSISTDPVISQPNPLGRGNTVVAQRSQIEIKQDKGALMMVKGANLGEVIKALNAIGATPQDLLSILQAMKVAGALRAELEII